MTKTLVLSLLKDIRDNMEPRIFTWETEDYFAELTYDDEVSGAKLGAPGSFSRPINC